MSTGDKTEFGITYVLDETDITRASTIEELAEQAMRQVVPARSEDASSRDHRARKTTDVKSSKD